MALDSSERVKYSEFHPHNRKLARKRFDGDGVFRWHVEILPFANRGMSTFFITHSADTMSAVEFRAKPLDVMYPIHSESIIQMFI